MTTTENNSIDQNGTTAHPPRQLLGSGVLARYGDLTLLQPVPTQDGAAGPPVDEPTVPLVLGVYCTKDHFNDPEVAYCSVCGISMAQGRMPELGTRPQLGVLVLDDGTTYPLARDHVVGQAPETDEAVAAGEASPVLLRDPLVSPLHARILLRDWQVNLVDAGSANGTFVQPRGQSSWTRSDPGLQTTLTPGAVVAFGHRQAFYYSYRSH